MANNLRDNALSYHRRPKPGKLEITATKPLGNQRDLALAYSPGVAFASEAIAANPDDAALYTARGNLVAVISNGTAVLGLGPIGPLAAKPVMEGKAVLFKKFAGIDCFDIEVNETDPDRFVDVVAALEPTFGAINLEDIKAPECFEIEQKLRERMSIPVFHDDQHGTAIIVGAAVLNGLEIIGKKIGEARLVASGAGAAALACLDLLVDLGLDMNNIVVTDKHGVVYPGRKEEMDPRKARYAKDIPGRGLDDVIDGTDIFLGLSAPNVLSADMVRRMADRPLILALANPVPEIMPDLAREAKPDAVIATGRSDFPNQVNNVLCFPFIFRGALDVGAVTINRQMEIACVTALAELAKAEFSDVAAKAYGGVGQTFGPDYIIPRPFDPRLMLTLAPAVARAAMDSGVATRPIKDFEAYQQRLNQSVFRSGLVMKPVFDRARSDPKRVVYADGEDERVLRAAQAVIDDGIATPIIVGRRRVVLSRLKRLGLRIRPDEDFEVVDPQDDPRYDEYWTHYHRIMERKGVSPDEARTIMRTRNVAIAALMTVRGEADAMICGVVGRFHRHLRHVLDIIGRAPGVSRVSTMNLLLSQRGTHFLCDTQVITDPTAEQIAEMALLAAAEMRRFGITPKAALLSYSNFGSSPGPSPEKMRRARELIEESDPQLRIEGEMHADVALNPELGHRLFPNSRLAEEANLLIFPNLDAANIAFNLVREMADALSVGPILLGTAYPAHVLTSAVTTRGIINISALAVVDAQAQHEAKQATPSAIEERASE